MKDEDYSSEEADSLTPGAVASYLVKSSIFNGEASFRVVIKDCTNNATLLVFDVQNISSKIKYEYIITRGTFTNRQCITHCGNRFLSLTESMGKRFHSIKTPTNWAP